MHYFYKSWAEKILIKYASRHVHDARAVMHAGIAN